MSVITVNNISKRYYIATTKNRQATLRDNISRLVIKLFKNNKKLEDNYFWALEDISFSVEKGEVFGIIGLNGVGKSTLLKILSRITPPTSGDVIFEGEVSSLLEVGTGFNPELTGRENIFLNGAILGMSKKEIEERMDSIIEFSGVKKFIHVPVKRYSSGMLVRLAFSVAVFLNSEVLLIDEVLAVGDYQFQKKCYDKIFELTRDIQKTILFVSHNLRAINKLCNRCLLLNDGKILYIGETGQVVEQYIKLCAANFSDSKFKESGQDNNKFINFAELKTRDNSMKPVSFFKRNDNIIFDIKIDARTSLEDCLLAISISDKENNLLINLINSDNSVKINLNTGINKVKVNIKNIQLNEGKYYVSFWLGNNLSEKPYLYKKNVCLLNIMNKSNILSKSPFIVDSVWEV